MKPPNFVEQVFIEHRDNGGMFDSEVGVQKVTAASGFRYRAYVTNSWGGGVQCFRDTPEQARAEIDRLWKRLFG